jgi:hypothetical protein
MLMSWCHGVVGIVIHPQKGVMKVHNTARYESRLIRKQNVGYKLCVYKAFCEQPLRKHICTMVSGSEGLHSLDVVWVKWLFMESSPEKWNTKTSSNCKFRDSLLLFSARELPKTSPYFSRHWFYRDVDGEVFAHLSEYYTPFKPATPLFLNPI